MSIDIVLFVLRVISAALLLSILGAVFLALWRDYQSTIKKLQSTRRKHGQLIALQAIDGRYVVLGETYPLLPITSIGRAPTNTIVVKDSFASNEHAQVVLRNGQWWLEDRRSRNGTTLNEIPIGQPVIMTDGDIIGIGSKRFRLELEK